MDIKVKSLFLLFANFDTDYLSNSGYFDTL